MKYLIIGFVFFVSFTLLGQNPTSPLINSEELLIEGTKLSNEGKHEEAISLYRQISESDTNYVKMLSKLIIAYNNNEQYEKAAAIGNQYKDSSNPYRVIFYNQLGIALLGLDEKEKAIEEINQALEKYPYEISLYFNLGKIYMKAELYNEAESTFKKGLKLNPFHSGIHILLGNIMTLKGFKTRAAMSYSMGIALNPTNNQALVILNNLFKNSLEFQGTIEGKPEELFKELELIINSNAATDPDFKSDIVLRAPVAQQMELILESLSFKENTQDFWMNFYVPLYTSYQNEEMENAFIHFILKSTDNKSVNKWIKKNEKELSSFFDYTNNYLKKYRETNHI